MSVEKIVEVPENKEVLLRLPDELEKGKRVKIVVTEVDEELEEKIRMFENAPHDKDFMADLWEVHKDFERAEGPLDERS